MVSPRRKGWGAVVKVESVDTATTRRLSIPRLEMSEGKADAVTSITALLDRAVVWAPGGKIASMYWAVYLVHLGSLRIFGPRTIDTDFNASQFR